MLPQMQHGNSIEYAGPLDIMAGCEGLNRITQGAHMPEAPDSAVKNVVLVHGGFVDGSGWEAVYGILRKDGFAVSVVQNPTTSLADDVVATRRVVAEHDGPVILVGHSYGGAVITEA